MRVVRPGHPAQDTFELPPLARQQKHSLNSSLQMPPYVTNAPRTSLLDLKTGALPQKTRSLPRHKKNLDPSRREVFGAARTPSPTISFSEISMDTGSLTYSLDHERPRVPETYVCVRMCVGLFFLTLGALLCSVLSISFVALPRLISSPARTVAAIGQRSSTCRPWSGSWSPSLAGTSVRYSTPFRGSSMRSRWSTRLPGEDAVRSRGGFGGALAGMDRAALSPCATRSILLNPPVVWSACPACDQRIGLSRWSSAPKRGNRPGVEKSPFACFVP